jgi:hypothetical protein
VGQALSQSPAEPNCSPTNVACQCSYQCCGEERCDGSICNQCVIDCVQRQQVVDKRSLSLKSRRQSLMTRGFKRLGNARRSHAPRRRCGRRRIAHVHNLTIACHGLLPFFLVTAEKCADGYVQFVSEPSRAVNRQASGGRGS